jgi:hypothetical protein
MYACKSRIYLKFTISMKIQLMHTNNSNQEIFRFYEREREKLEVRNPWAMESPCGMLRDYVFKKLGVRGRYKLVQPPLQA